MATQSLYRRYRPRKFSEVKGQEHVVRALRNAVINHREGQAYMFSGPRGTGKTTSARILAKVLNCERPVDGEPCCECDSCIAVERGTSYDVHELDAASNNGVDAMRDLIEKASLGTPGRHKVYILDEVHMLSKPAEAALLKTLEEPPPHVVFVLATTDPQKVSETIRSRTQHLNFHLLPMDVMEEHIRWLAQDAGIDIDEAAMQSVLRQGGGSARDTVSALELVAASGGLAIDITPLDEFIEAFIERDPARALTVVAHAVQLGRDPRTLTDDIVRHLRDCFLSLMAPELVQLPAQREVEVQSLATRMGAAAIVRAMERLGEMLVEMRHAPDPRLLLEVALVQLTHEASQSDTSVILTRLERLEAAVASGAAVAPTPKPAPIDPSTGRAALGGRARREPGASTAVQPPPEAPTAAGPTPTQRSASASAAAASSHPVSQSSRPAPRAVPALPPDNTAVAAHPSNPVPAADAVATAAQLWSSDVLTGLKGLARAMFAAFRVLGERDGKLALGAPSEVHRAKSAAHVKEVEAVLAKVVGSPVSVMLVVDGSPAEGFDDFPGGAAGNVVQMKRGGATPPPLPPADEDVDITDLVDVPPDSVLSPVDRLLQAFPGSTEMDERR
jgi:DNA polymerase-3 subunit gamma/tau